jgi:hypothetical protein
MNWTRILKVIEVSQEPDELLMAAVILQNEIIEGRKERTEKIGNNGKAMSGAQRIAKHRLKVRAMRKGLGIEHSVNQPL